MKFYQVISSIPYLESYIPINENNTFEDVKWIHSFECDYSLVKLNNSIIEPPENFNLTKKLLNNKDLNFLENKGWCPFYWYFEITQHNMKYGYTLICEEILKQVNKKEYTYLLSYLRGKKIDSILDGFFIQSQ